MPDREPEPSADITDPFRAWIEASDRRWERIADRLIPVLERIAAALESRPAAEAGPAPARSDRARQFREAVDAGDWPAAEALATDPELDPAAAATYAARLGEARDRARAALRAEIDAARGANDPAAVLDLRDRLAPLLDPDAARASDQDLIRWLMGLIQRRLRSGTIAPDVAQLAAAVAARFASTPEGASLRAALPTLRRSTGLCPRCGEPYVGDEDACPDCLKAAPAPPPSPSSVDAPESAWADEPEPEEREPFDINEERNWDTA